MELSNVAVCSNYELSMEVANEALGRILEKGQCFDPNDPISSAMFEVARDQVLSDRLSERTAHSLYGDEDLVRFNSLDMERRQVVDCINNNLRGECDKLALYTELTS